MAVTAEQAQAAARKYWAPSRLSIVAVGDGSKIKDALAKKGELEVYDADGDAGTARSRKLVACAASDCRSSNGIGIDL